MLELYFLEGEDDPFPPTHFALTEPNGLLAAGGSLSPQRLLNAYSQGIFPWFDEDQPILWWSPDPRMVLPPEQVHCSKSMAKLLRKSPWQVKVDCDFEQVMKACAGTRPYADGTWITDDMLQAYCELHDLGYAHCVSVYEDEQLIGGLYGLALGRVFFGESMFSHKSNASKFATIRFASWLDQQGFKLIDCQVANPHLESLGGHNITRSEFEEQLRVHCSIDLIHSYQDLWQTAKEQSI